MKLRTIVFLFLVVCALFLPSTSAEIGDWIRDGDYVYVNDDKVYLNATYSISHGQPIEHSAMTKQYTGDCDLAIGFDGEVAWPTKVLLEDPHYVYWNTDTSEPFYYINNFGPTTDTPDYGNSYNTMKYKFDHKIFIGYDNITNESIWQDIYGTVAYFDSQVNDGTNYTITWHTEHSQLEQYRDISNRILSNPIEYEFDNKNLWYITKDIPMTAGVMRKIIIEMDGNIELGEQSYKYDIIWKPSHQTISEAKNAGNLYVLDPYWNTTFSSRLPITITTTGTSTPANYQVLLNISYESEMQVDFDDIRFTNSSNVEIAYWIESKVDSNYANVWVELSDVISDPGSDAVWMYYGNPGLSDGGDIGDTFLFGDDFEDGTLDKWTGDTGSYTVDGGSAYSGSYGVDRSAVDGSWENVFGANDYDDGIWEMWVREGVDNSYPRFGLRYVDESNYVAFQIQSISDQIKIDDVGGTGENAASIDLSVSTWYFLRATLAGTSAKLEIFDTSMSLLQTVTHTVTDRNDAHCFKCYRDTQFDNYRVRKYIADEPTSSYGTVQYYTDSLHYNETSPYNHTIESDGIITSNRSIFAIDDTNDTAQSTGISYLIINGYDNDAIIVRNFTFTGDDLDWYQAANLSGDHNLENSSGTIETQSNGNFTTNLTAGTYWIEKTIGVSISLVSFTPSPLNTNYTGATVISYMVESTNPLNLSSLAFLHGVNYTVTGDMYNYLSVPNNSISYDGFYKAPNRNVTPYLSWEFNDTITEGNVWKWGGGDNNSSWITKTPINATHTWINVTRMVPQSLSNAYFIHDEAVYNAPMIGFEINRQQGLILKGWDLDQIRNRNNNYFVNLFFDTSLESTLPTYPIEIGYCNDSYDPTVDDIDTCPYCTKFLEWNGTRWINHSWVPSVNASYASPLVINALYFTDPSPDDIAYVWLRSYAHSSKSYVLNATDYDPGLTNITFAETESMWTYNELNGVTSPVAYTPSYFAMFTRDFEDFLHHLYIADDQGVWGHSDIFSEPIGVSSVPVSPVSFEHFNVTCNEDYIEDTLMDATYDDGSMLVNIFCPADPDGGTVSHNLTLHYALNQSLVAVINDTFTTTGNEYVDINFTTTPYYSTSNFYTLRCISTDDENDVATKWLISDFTLDADGNQGWVADDALLFWGMNDIPTLYSTVANDSLISYNAGSDIYTMHVPFFKSKSNDTFYFNETVHLKSLNNEDVAYFRHSGITIFDYATIHAWNTTTDTAAPTTDEYRGYVYSHFHVCGNITNSDFSYLGGDFYRQEGLNFIDNPHDYLIYNTTFLHNAEGPIMEDCSNMNISQCTITNNVNTGVGIYFTNDTTVSNNVIDSNGGRSITIYEANNNIISYNYITNSGIHGVHYWSNSINNTCIGNDISGSALYDYYLSSSSLGNYIIDPTSTINQIRVTSTSSVNIENTDNAVFTEDSLNTSYAYLTNFSMFVSSASQTFDITQRDMTILPSTDKVTIWNFEWGPTIVFDITSETEINPTWFNITHDEWSNKDIYIYRNDDDYATELATESGKITFNYSENLINIRFRFTSETPAWDTLINSIAWAISIAQFLVANIGTVIVTAFSLTCILIIMILIGMALSVTNIIYR